VFCRVIDYFVVLRRDILLQEDLKLWLPSPDSPPDGLDLKISRYLLNQVGDQFCDLLKQEKEAIDVHMSEGLLRERTKVGICNFRVIAVV
jgi:hypothetical protein